MLFTIVNRPQARILLLMNVRKNAFGLELNATGDLRVVSKKGLTRYVIALLLGTSTCITHSLYGAISLNLYTMVGK